MSLLSVLSVDLLDDNCMLVSTDAKFRLAVGMLFVIFVNIKTMLTY